MPLIVFAWRNKRPLQPTRPCCSTWLNTGFGWPNVPKREGMRMHPRKEGRNELQQLASGIDTRFLLPRSFDLVPAAGPYLGQWHALDHRRAPRSLRPPLGLRAALVCLVKSQQHQVVSRSGSRSPVPAISMTFRATISVIGSSRSASWSERQTAAKFAWQRMVDRFNKYLRPSEHNVVLRSVRRHAPIEVTAPHGAIRSAQAYAGTWSVIGRDRPAAFVLLNRNDARARSPCGRLFRRSW